MRKKSSMYYNLDRCLNPDEKIITRERGCIGRENERACVCISGVPFDDNAAFYKELNLIVATNKCCKKVPLKPGYNPQVALLDFNGAGNEIYVTIDSGGSGGYQFFYIFEYYRCELKVLMSDEIFNAKYDKYTGRYLDYFRAQVSNNGDVWRIDLSCKGEDYLSQIYYADGKLIAPKEIFISGANYTFPQYDQNLERYTLVVYQEIWGLYHADNLGYMETTMKFDNGKYEVQSIYLKTNDDNKTDCIIY